ncbi:hypothetical protein K474DRAFT_1709190 [Panus rudis PR-1116 ss-1]|nr:hypothetical protein K474DRAFT_1709190 [Panus rudis PR-1116 ss-1]
MLSTPAARMFQICLLGYSFVAVLYSTKTLVNRAASAGGNISGMLSSRTFMQSLDKTPGKSSNARFTMESHTTFWDLDTTERANSSTGGIAIPSSDALMRWPSMVNSLTILGSSNFTTLREETILSKAFVQSMHPTKIIPYYFRASGEYDPNDVTITTLVTRNRFQVLKQLVERYQGPISVTIHIPMPDANTRKPDTLSAFQKSLRDLHALYSSSPYFAAYVDVHLALSPFSRTIKNTGTSTEDPDGQGEGGRQFNVWRNVARLFARTEFVMMLDVDFAVCTDWRTSTRNSLRKLRNGANWDEHSMDAMNLGPSAVNETAKMEIFSMLKDGTAALVVPAFEYISQEDGADQQTFPRDKETLLQLTVGSQPEISSFHASWAAGHNSTNYARYYSIPPGRDDIYKVTQYQSAYEPYVITSKRISWCDERFTGYGGNKAACLFEMYMSGVSFYVLSDHFLIHQNHKYEEQARREERKYNRKLYADFKEETCLRYLHRFYHEGALNTPKATNAKDECKKLKGMPKIAHELFDIEL